MSAILRWRGRILLIRHEKGGRDAWLLPGGGVRTGESLIRALRRELWEETGLFDAGVDVPLEGPVAIVDSISPANDAYRKHVVHVVFAADVTGSLEEVSSQDEAVRGHRAFHVGELDGITLHPPIQRFLQRWRPGDPAVYLGELWAP